MSSDHNIGAETVQIRRNNIQVAVVPVNADGSWTYGPTPDLPLGLHVFTAHVGDKQSAPWTVNVQENEMRLTAPHFRDAASVGANAEEINYYIHSSDGEGDGYIEIPDYGAQPDDTVRVEWVGRNFTYHSEIQRVVNPAVMPVFKISQYEIIDCISDNAGISYTVQRLPGAPQTSVSQNLRVQGNPFVVRAPTLGSAHDNLRVWLQADFNENSTARVRAIGLTTWQSDIQYFNNEPWLNFPIPQTWIAENRGRPILFNWSLRLNPGQTNSYYSQIGRENIFAAAESSIEQIDPQTRDAIYNFIVSAYTLVKQLFKR
jgi:hypothetical protein